MEIEKQGDIRKAMIMEKTGQIVDNEVLPKK